MRLALRVAGILCAIVCVGVWLAFGTNRGWTKTTHTRMEKDPVTEIEYPTVEKRFSPGVELLGVGLLISAMIASISFFVGSKQNRSTNYD